ncbi:acyl-CoA N-acyltransferase [Coprinopsis marcescibilis]|uniref:Acyl-CoA N-acyltransferase n=1 Tax=Coprinopsis marcescibilis TaxID=230819 RepID=A0A5C3KRR0_COPMA|nr:acyl-CoA N-acyltransferase [Coprinopsis marcescibilis]
MATPDILFDLIKSDEVKIALEIEQEGYPADEAGTLESFSLRQSQAGSLFLGAFLPSTEGGRKLIGYVCSTLSPDKTLTHDSMSHHVPESSSICIHSVCIAKEFKGQGVGLQLLKEYVKRVRSAEGNPYERILLITHDDLREFYEKAGFEWVGESPVIHGSKPWYEMRIVLSGEGVASAGDGAPQISPEALRALLQPSSQTRSPEFVPDFQGGIDDLVVPDPNELGSSVNKYDFLCPRGCRSIILKSGSARIVERTSVIMEPETSRRNPLLAALPPPPETANWWLVSGSPMTFENIGFTRPVEAIPIIPGERTKLLICAECDLGPLGWCVEGGSEFWLAVSRVGYRRE